MSGNDSLVKKDPIQIKAREMAIFPTQNNPFFLGYKFGDREYAVSVKPSSLRRARTPRHFAYIGAGGGI